MGWPRDSGRGDTIDQDLAVLGAREFKPQPWMIEQDESPEEFGVLPENLEAVLAFLGCATQWQHGAADQALGIPYERLEIVMKRMRVADPDDAFWRVRVMERVALREFAKQRKS